MQRNAKRGRVPRVHTVMQLEKLAGRINQAMDYSGQVIRWVAWIVCVWAALLAAAMVLAWLKIGYPWSPVAVMVLLSPLAGR